MTQGMKEGSNSLVALVDQVEISGGTMRHSLLAG